MCIKKPTSLSEFFINFPKLKSLDNVYLQNILEILNPKNVFENSELDCSNDVEMSDPHLSPGVTLLCSPVVESISSGVILSDSPGPIDPQHFVNQKMEKLSLIHPYSRQAVAALEKILENI